MIATTPDITTTLFTLPPDAKFLPVAELSPRLRARIGAVEEGQSVITRPGFRVTTRLVPGPLADLIAEFRAPSLITDAVSRFAQTHQQDPMATLDLAFDALATLVEARILVPDGSPDAQAPAPSLAVGQAFAGFEVEALVRGLEDSEVYRARGPEGTAAALKIARENRPAVAAAMAHEARVLERLDGGDTPRLIDSGTARGRAFIAMEWCDGVSIGVAAQQARAARDRRRLHSLVSSLFEAYGRLHDRGLLHGDIHPGNCLVRDDGRVVLLDFGSARAIDATLAIDPARTGIPHFYDPQMAAALAAGELPPAVTPASEQYAVAVLAYTLMTGLAPIDSPAVQDELLRRIAERSALPFTARGVPAWPDVEAVLRRALARQPEDRFPDVAGLARACRSASVPANPPPRWPDRARQAFEAAVESVRALAPSATPLLHAWFALRAALALEDAELLGAADILAARAGSDPAALTVVAHVARARSDGRTENRAIAAFLDAAGRLRDGRDTCAAVVAAASILTGGAMRSPDAARLAEWAAERLDALARAAASRRPRRVPEAALVHAALALARTGTAVARADLPDRVEALSLSLEGDVWMWALAHDVLADDRFKALALAAPRPRRPLPRGVALVRLHQLTGDRQWIDAAHRVLMRAPGSTLPVLDTALMMVELMAPERAMLPPFRLLSPVSGRR